MQVDASAVGIMNMGPVEITLVLMIFVAVVSMQVGAQDLRLVTMGLIDVALLGWNLLFESSKEL